MEAVVEQQTVEVPERTLREFGAELIEQARKKFPSDERCGSCRFRKNYHNGFEHNFNEVVDPFVLALEGFVNQVVALQSEQPDTI